MEFDIPIYDDSLCEPNETVKLFISTSSLPHRVTGGHLHRIMMTILDNDSKFCLFCAAIIELFNLLLLYL